MLSESNYEKLFPTGSWPGLFYGMAKVHKLQGNQGLKELTVRPIISNISYETANYRNNLLSPLRKSQRMVFNSKKFVEKIKAEIIPIGYKMILFDVKSLFTNVPLDEMIKTITKGICGKEN